MTIETKFNYGEQVFVLFRDKVHQVQIVGITADVAKEITTRDTVVHRYNAAHTHCKYAIQFQSGGIGNGFDEEELFHTNQQLINSL